MYIKLAGITNKNQPLTLGVSDNIRHNQLWKFIEGQFRRPTNPSRYQVWQEFLQNPVVQRVKPDPNQGGQSYDIFVPDGKPVVVDKLYAMPVY